MSETTVLTDEQIASLLNDVLRASGSSLSNYTMQMGIDRMKDSVRAIEQAVLQSPEVQAWKKDAERYRHLRDDGEIGPHDLFNAWWLSEHGNPQTLDAAIDAAMEKRP